MGFLIAFVLFGFSACKKSNPDDIVHINKEDYTAEDQKIFGDNLHEAILSSDQFNKLDRTSFSEFYNHLETTYQTLSKTTLIENRDLFSWDVTILKDDEQRMAFCAPGGHFYIYTGLLKYIKAEHELVAVMAHEIHYANTGIVMDALKAEFNSDAFLLGDIFLGNEVNEAEDVAYFLANHIYDVADVQAADEFALEIICPFLYNPMGLTNLLERAIQTSNLDWLHRRPGSGNRLNILNKRAIECGNIEEDPTFGERYQSFIQDLP